MINIRTLSKTLQCHIVKRESSSDDDKLVYYATEYESNGLPMYKIESKLKDLQESKDFEFQVVELFNYNHCLISVWS